MCFANLLPLSLAAETGEGDPSLDHAQERKCTTAPRIFYRRKEQDAEHDF